MSKNAEEFLKELEKGKSKFAAMLAPSFAAVFDYPEIILKLRKFGFDKIVELTFGAKMINRDYHEILKTSKGLMISSVCPGIVETIRTRFPYYFNNLIKVDSPMIAMAKICKKAYPKHKVVFISPCDFKKIEAEHSEFVDYAICYDELEEAFSKKNITASKSNKNALFDKFYNDFTKIYPLSGGLSKTAHIKGILKKDEIKIIDGINEVIHFLKHPDKKIKFLDATFCRGGCIGGPCIKNLLGLTERKQRVMEYMEIARKEPIQKGAFGAVEKAKGIRFRQ